jgi:cell division inhibitor SepF
LFNKIRHLIGLEEEKLEKETKQPLIHFPAPTKNSNKRHKEMEIDLFKPKDWNSAVEHIAETLRRGNTVIVNLKLMDLKDSKRLLDFVCGTTYAIDGYIHKIDKQIYLFAPNQVVVKSDDNDNEMVLPDQYEEDPSSYNSLLRSHIG